MKLPSFSSRSGQQVVMVPASKIQWNFNLKHPPFRKHEARLEKSILREGLKHPLEVTQGKKGIYEGLEGWSRWRVIQRLHRARRSFRFRQTGEIVKIGKVPVIGTETKLDPRDARFLAVRSNLDRRRVHPLELGHQFWELTHLLKYGEIGEAKQQIADECGHSDEWVDSRIRAWERLPQDEKDAWLGVSKKKTKLKPSHFFELSKLETKEGRSVMAKRIEGKPYGTAKIMIRGFRELEKRFPPATKEQAKRTATQALKQISNRSQTVTFDLSEMPLMKDSAANIVLEAILCPSGLRLTSVPCPECGQQECPQKGTEMNLTDCKAQLKFACPTDLYEKAILAAADEIKRKPLIALKS